MNYADALAFLTQLRRAGATFGLETTRRLAARAGDPQRALRFIHVAGTNGKGSTCAFLESIYRAAGLRVGLFTSPHLVSITERIQVQRQPIAEQRLARLVASLREWMAPLPTEAQPTLFEALTIIALRYFADEACDLVIWETGLGGRLDATNIVTPLASVITTIDFDHQEFLGDSLEKIAAEKVGIMKPRVPVITAARPGRGLEVIAENARRLACPITVVDDADTAKLSDHATLPLRGEHQRWNAAVAIATVRALRDRLPASDDVIARGLATVSWAGRMHVVRHERGPTVILDGAHNSAGAAALASTWRAEFPKANPALVIGVLRDKDWREIARHLAPFAARIFVVPVPSERGLAPDELATECAAANPQVAVRVCASLGDALAAAASEAWIIVTGSLYLVGEAMQNLGVAPAPQPVERGLNEWKGTRNV